jgi:hypothetical protein
MESNIAMARGFFDNYKKTAPPLIAEVGDMLLTNLKVDEQNQIVKVSTNVPDSAQEKLEQLPPIVMMMAMTGGIAPVVSTGTMSESKDVAIAGSAGVEQKLKGDPVSVEAIESTGLIDGMTMSAKTAWSVAPAGFAERTRNPEENPTAKAVDFVIDVTGDGIETICGSTEAIPKSITLEGGVTLKKNKQNHAVGGIPDTAIRPFEAWDKETHEHPAKTLRVKATFDIPKSDAAKIKSFEGFFRILAAESSHELTIENATKKANHALTDPEFKAADIQLHSQRSNGRLNSFSLSCGKHCFIGRVRGAPGEITCVTSSKQGRTIQQLFPQNQSDQFPDDFQINFTLHSNVTEHLVKFHFENVPLPSHESTPVAEAPMQPNAPAQPPPNAKTSVPKKKSLDDF